MSSTGPTASYTRCSMRVPAGRSCRSSQNVILSRSGTNLRWRGQRRDRSDRRQKFLAGTYRFECLPEGEEGPLVLSYEHSEIQRHCPASRSPANAVGGFLSSFTSRRCQLGSFLWHGHARLALTGCWRRKLRAQRIHQAIVLKAIPSSRLGVEVGHQNAFSEPGAPDTSLREFAM